MAFKIVCDHCGNDLTIDTYYQYAVHSQTPDRSVPTTAHQAVLAQNAQAGWATPNHQHGAQALEAYEPLVVQLCINCKPVWLQRVRNLTERSNPESKDGN